MKTVLNRRTLLLGAALSAAGSCLAHADDGEDEPDDDHDRARRALEERRARPLVEILAAVKDRLNGEVVGMRFERKDGRYVYEFKIVAPDGRLHEVHVDAMTAEILMDGGD